MEKQTRREFLATAGAAASAGALLGAPRSVGTARATETGRQPGSEIQNPKSKIRNPNVVLVMTDDQGYGDLGCHGNPIIQTPNLDRLHAQSTRLTNFHVDPTCSPTRSALMTGRYSSRTGVWHTIMGRSLLRRDEITMADIFAASGYRTAIFGKWHLGDNYPFRPQDRGFHEVLVYGGGGIGQTPDFWGNDYFDDTYWHNGRLRKFSGYCTDVWFENALEFIESNRNRPFFCYIPTNAPHGPYNVPDNYRKIYEDKGVPEHQARFWGMITNIDENMGRLLQGLRQWNLEDNTIVIFMTDNGTSGDYDAGMGGKKGSEYDGGHRVPFFIRWGARTAARLEAGRDISRITAHIDVLPTLIELCGLNNPEPGPGPKGASPFDGASLVPLLTGKGKWPERTLIVHSQRIEHPEKWRKSAVMTDRWRLVNGHELYDMTADPGQEKDVADQHREVVEKLRNAYEEWWADISERFDEYCEIILGSERENPAWLTCHDWHGPEVPWHQRHVHDSQLYANGFWAVEVARSGRYEFTLRQRPAEAKFPIHATRARLKIANVDVSKPIAQGVTGVTFDVELEAGATRLQTWFTDEQSGKSRGAYFVSVRYIAPAS